MFGLLISGWLPAFRLRRIHAYKGQGGCLGPQKKGWSELRLDIRHQLDQRKPQSASLHSYRSIAINRFSSNHAK